MAQVMIHNTHGKDNAERASLAFVAGNTTLSSGQEATMLLMIEEVWVATPGYLGGLQANGFLPLREFIEKFVQNGGRIWVCGACARPRNITGQSLSPGAEIVGAAVEAMVNGTRMIGFCTDEAATEVPISLAA
jgi:predicted peroxiredoxin